MPTAPPQDAPESPSAPSARAGAASPAQTDEPDRRAAEAQPRAHHLDHLVWAFLIIGSVLRVIWPLDMEWKFDEKWMFEKGLAIAQGREAWPWVGMPSGVGLQNPGASIWPFALIAYVAPTPVGMMQAIAWLNTLGLWALALWVQKTWPNRERALGLWGIALFAVSPLAILFSRKIWAQDVLIVLIVPWLWGQRRRTTLWGAATWGLCGALLGQIHMSGFFAATALLVVTVLRDRLRWHVPGWFAGSVVGALPLLPWLGFVFSPGARSVSHGGHLSLKFFTDALRHAWGLGLEYPLGRDYRVLLRGPELAGIDTHLGQVARYGLLLLLAWGVFTRLRQRKAALPLPEPVYTYAGCVVLTGLLLLVARVEVHAHYLIVLGPMLHIAAVWLLFSRRAAVVSMCALQALLSAYFIVFVHARGGAADADYGKAYRVQSLEERSLPTE